MAKWIKIELIPKDEPIEGILFNGIPFMADRNTAINAKGEAVALTDKPSSVGRKFS